MDGAPAASRAVGAGPLPASLALAAAPPTGLIPARAASSAASSSSGLFSAWGGRGAGAGAPAAARPMPPFAPPAYALPPSAAVPFVPPLLVGGDFPEQRDPLAFTEHCLVRGAGATVMGGLFGFFLGGFFSGYGQLGAYDPALRDWQQTVAKAVEEGGKKGAAGAAAAPPAAGGAAAATPAAAAAAAAAAHPHPPAPPPVAQPWAPVRLPELRVPSPLAPLWGGGLSAAARSAAATPAEVVARAAAGAAAPAAPAAPPALSLPVPLPGGLPFSTEPPAVPLRVAFVQGLREMGTRAVSSGRNFALVGGVYATIECTLEKARGRRDLQNALASGFATGALLAVRGGPVAMAMGGAGFAAFSGAIEILSPYIFDGGH
jgi:hypothetical protein